MGEVQDFGCLSIYVNWFLTSSTGWSASSVSANSECLLCHSFTLSFFFLLSFFFFFLIACPNFLIPAFYIPFQNSISLARSVFPGHKMRFCRDFPVLLCPDDDYLISLYPAAGTLREISLWLGRGLGMGDEASQEGIPPEEKYYSEWGDKDEPSGMCNCCVSEKAYTWEGWHANSLDLSTMTFK